MDRRKETPPLPSYAQWWEQGSCVVVPENVLRRTDLSGNAKLIFGLLLGRAVWQDCGETLAFTPEKLAHTCGISNLRDMHVALDGLERKGLLQVIDREADVIRCRICGKP